MTTTIQPITSKPLHVVEPSIGQLLDRHVFDPFVRAELLRQISELAAADRYKQEQLNNVRKNDDGRVKEIKRLKRHRIGLGLGFAVHIFVWAIQTWR